MNVIATVRDSINVYHKNGDSLEALQNTAREAALNGCKVVIVHSEERQGGNNQTSTIRTAYKASDLAKQGFRAASIWRIAERTQIHAPTS